MTAFPLHRPFQRFARTVRRATSRAAAWILPLIVVATALLATGCVSTEITSTKAPDYEDQIQHLYVATRIPVEIEPVETAVLMEFQKRFAEQSTPIDTASLASPDTVRKAKKLSLDDPSMDVPYEKAREAAASNVLVLQQRSQQSFYQPATPMPNPNGPGMMMMMGGRSGEVYVFDASLYDVETERRVWRGQIEASGSLQGSPERTGRYVVEEILKDWKKKVILPFEFQVADSSS